MADDPYRPMFADPIGPWFRWFAWRPVCTIDRGWRWLRPVWRRATQTKMSLPGPTITAFQNVVSLGKEAHRG